MGEDLFWSCAELKGSQDTWLRKPGDGELMHAHETDMEMPECAARETHIGRSCCSHTYTCVMFRCTRARANKSAHLRTAGLSDTSDPRKEGGTKRKKEKQKPSKARKRREF